MTDSEAFLQHLGHVFDANPEIRLVESATVGQPGIGCLYFQDAPERGILSAVTYGLSRATHPDWKRGKPELIISLRTRDKAWGLAVARLAEQHRFEWSFSYGQTINLHERVSPESEMSAFFIFAPAILTPEAYSGIELPSTIVNISGVYPMYEGEIALLRAIGFQPFWRLPTLDILNVKRPDLSKNPSNWQCAKLDS